MSDRGADDHRSGKERDTMLAELAEEALRRPLPELDGTVRGGQPDERAVLADDGVEAPAIGPALFLAPLLTYFCVRKISPLAASGRSATPCRGESTVGQERLRMPADRDRPADGAAV